MINQSKVFATVILLLILTQSNVSECSPQAYSLATLSGNPFGVLKVSQTNSKMSFEIHFSRKLKTLPDLARYRFRISAPVAGCSGTPLDRSRAEVVEILDWIVSDHVYRAGILVAGLDSQFQKSNAVILTITKRDSEEVLLCANWRNPLQTMK